jgi:hypothetical protein
MNDTNEGRVSQRQTREQEQREGDAFRRIFVRAMDIEDAGFNDKPGWRARLYIWLLWDVWYQRVSGWLRLPSEPSLKYVALVLGIVATLVGIGVGLLTFAEKWRALR